MPLGLAPPPPPLQDPRSCCGRYLYNDQYQQRHKYGGVCMVTATDGSEAILTCHLSAREVVTVNITVAWGVTPCSLAGHVWGVRPSKEREREGPGPVGTATPRAGIRLKCGTQPAACPVHAACHSFLCDKSELETSRRIWYSASVGRLVTPFGLSGNHCCILTTYFPSNIWSS
jgi:hypothetical protein